MKGFIKVRSMSKAVTEQINLLFEAVKDLESLEEIKPHCDKFNAWVRENTSYSNESLGTVLSRSGFYKKFRSIPLVQGKNAESINKHNENGEVIGTKLDHYVILLCGLSNKEWEDRNSTTRVTDRLQNGQEIDPDLYLEVTGKLLESSNPHELAVGLIAATGRRPHEILVRAKFSVIKGEDYQVKFSGQGKKRGESPVFPIATLYPAKYIAEKLKQLHSQEVTKKLLAEINREFPGDIPAQNRAIDSKRNGSLNRVVREFFGDKKQSNPVLQFRYGEEQDNNKALRAAYICLAVERDCEGSIGSKMLHAAKLAGHFIGDEKVNDSELKHLVTTLGYSDYYTTKSVNFPTMNKEKTLTIRAIESDYEAIKKLQVDLDLPNQQSLISHLVESYMNRVDTAKKVQSLETENSQLKTQIKQLQEDKKQMEVSQVNLLELQTENAKLKEQINQLQQAKTQTEVPPPAQPISLDSKDLESWLNKRLETLLNEKLAGMNIPATQQTREVVVPVKQVKEVDLTGLTNAELWGEKRKGAPDEKIRRSFLAICDYNDTLATGDNDRLAITNLALSQLSGANRGVIGEWVAQHRDEVVSHNAKYGMGNKKDPTSTETYFNKGKDVDRLLRLVSDNFLDGQAIK